MKNHGRNIGGLEITGVIKVVYYENGMAWVWINGKGSFYTDSGDADRIYNIYDRRVK